MVADLVEATAVDNMAQLPQDLDTANDIIIKTLDLLISNLDQAENNTNATTVDVNLSFLSLAIIILTI